MYEQTNSSILFKVKDIHDNVEADKKTYKKCLQKWETMKISFKTAEYTFAGSSVSCAISGLAVPISLPFTVPIGLTAGGCAFGLSMGSDMIENKIHKFKQLLLISENFTDEYYNKYLFNELITNEDFKTLTEMYKNYKKTKKNIKNKPPPKSKKDGDKMKETFLQYLNQVPQMNQVPHQNIQNYSPVTPLQNSQPVPAPIYPPPQPIYATPTPVKQQDLLEVAKKLS